MSRIPVFSRTNTSRAHQGPDRFVVSRAWIVVFFLIAACVWGGWKGWQHVQQQRYERTVRATFVETVDRLKQQMEVFTGVNLRFFPPDYAAVPFTQQEALTGYILQLRRDFSTAVDRYNQTYKLPVELDVEQYMRNMSRDKKIAQLFMFGTQGRQLTIEDAQFFLDQEPGGVIVMGENVSENLDDFLSSIQDIHPELPMFIAVDQEGGPVKRIPEELPGQANISPEDVCEVYSARDTLLGDLGININFGIVADIAVDPRAYIASRTFTGDIAGQIETAVRCTQQTLSTLKHYPGHGAVQGDSHTGIQRIDRSCDDMKQTHFPPFLAGVHAGADLVMLGHLLLPCIDETLPASLSSQHIRKLRDFGFSGLVITDDMDMLASNYTREEALQLALLAGNDIILYVDSTGKRKDILREARRLVDTAIVSIESIDVRVKHILEKKNELIRSDTYVPADLYIW